MVEYTLEIRGRPVPKSYGKNKGNWYPKKKVRKKEKEIADLFESKYDEIKSSENFRLDAKIVVPNKRRGDLKNYIYLIEDALTGSAYEDDKQVIEHHTSIRLHRGFNKEQGLIKLKLIERPDLEELPGA